MKQEIKEQVEKIRNGEIPGGYQKTKVGIIPVDWDNKKLIQIADYVDYRGKTPQKTNNGVFLVTAKNIKKGFIDYETSKEFVSENKYMDIMSRGLPKLGDVLITTEAPVGNVAQIDKENIALAQRVIKYRGKEDEIDNTYMKFYFLGFKFQKEILIESTGGTVQGIKGSRLHKLKVSFPKIKEQEKIAEILSTWDEAIELKEKLIEEKKEFKRGLMQKLLTGKVRFPEFTDDWTEYQLKDICKFMKGSGLSKDKLSINGDIKCILYGELYTTYSEVIQEVKSKTNIVEGVPSQKGDVLIPASTTTTGIDLANATALEEKSVLLGGDINILRNDKSLFNSSFLAHYLTHVKKFDLASKAQGMTIVHLYGKHLKKIQVDIPQVKEQEKIVQVLSLQDDEIEMLAEKLLQLKQQKKGLMQLLLTGIVRVEVD